MLVIPHLLNRYLSERRGSALTSASKDGEIVAAFLDCFRILPVRGSSSRRGAIAMREMVRLIGDGTDVAITPDGPRGPRYALCPGAVTLAQATNAKVLPIRVRYSRCWRLKSWDAFQIPKPFSVVAITLLALESVPPTPDAESFERERARLEMILRAGQVETDSL